MLVVKCLQHNQEILPPDLLPSSLSYGITLRQGEVVTLLDFDHFATKANEFDPKYVVVAKSGELHDALDLAFREAVTDEALIRWGKKRNPDERTKILRDRRFGPISPPYILRCGALE